MEQLEAKIAMLDDSGFRTKTVTSWSDGVHNSDWSAIVAVGAGVVTGLFAGFLNGILIVSLRIVPFIVTLGTMSIYIGIGRCISSNVTIRPSKEYQIPDWLQHILLRLPFQAIYYTPLMMVTRPNQDWGLLLSMLGVQAAWVVVAFVLTRLFYNQAVKVLRVAGG